MKFPGYHIRASIHYSGKTSYRKISWSLEAARFGFKLFQSLWNLADTSAALLRRCLSNFRAIRPLQFRGFETKTSYRLVNRGPGNHFTNKFSHHNSNSMENLFSSDSTTGDHIATKFGTCHDSPAIVPCTKFCSDYCISTWMRAKWNFHHIWIVMEKLLVKWAPGSAGTRSFSLSCHSNLLPAPLVNGHLRHRFNIKTVFPGIGIPLLR